MCVEDEWAKPEYGQRILINNFQKVNSEKHIQWDAWAITRER